MLFMEIQAKWWRLALVTSMSVRNPLVIPIYNVNMVIFLQNGYLCVLKHLVDVKLLLDKKKMKSFIT